MATQIGTVTIDFGSTPTNTGTILVTGLTGLTLDTHKEAYVQADDTTVDNTAVEHRLLGIWCRFSCEYVSATTMNIHCDLFIGEVIGTFKIHYVTAS